jgi:hypothetical protein
MTMTEKRGKHGILPALAFIFIMLCLPGMAVVWQYVDSYSPASSNVPSSLSSPASTSDVNSRALAAGRSTAIGGGLWSWGSTPRGFSVSNGTLKYPDDYYTSHFNLGYGKIESPYGKNKLGNLSQYSTGFATGFVTDYPGYNIYNLLSDGKSSYDPWNNYPGYDPNYPYGYPST